MYSFILLQKITELYSIYTLTSPFSVTKSLMFFTNFVFSCFFIDYSHSFKSLIVKKSLKNSLDLNTSDLVNDCINL